jgi:hypothetical protein
MRILTHCGLFLLLIASSANANAIYTVTLDTSSLAADTVSQPFYVAFEFVDGSGTGDANNSVFINNVQLGGGALLPPASTFGNGVSGDLSTSVQLTDVDPFEYFAEAFDPGSSLQFNLDLTTNLDAGSTQDELLFWILDDTQTPIPTSAADGQDELALFTIDTPSPDVATAGSPSGVPAPTVVSEAPEPSAFWLTAVALAFIVFRFVRARLPWRALVNAATAFLLMCVAASAQSPTAFSCQIANGAVTPTIRAEGLTENVGDVIILCTGGIPSPAGSTLPQINLTVTLNAPVTSRIEGTGGASEALLLVDEPGSPVEGAVATQLPCGTPLTGCSIVANGGEPYDGITGPNVFEGVVTAPNAITFFGVPLQVPGFTGGGLGANPPSVGGTRVFRFTNFRVDASQFGVSDALGATVVSSVSVTGGDFPLFSPGSTGAANGAITTAFVLQGLAYQTRNASDTAPISNAPLSGCVAGSPCQVATVRFAENFDTAFKVATQTNPQNIPGMIYNSESGFFSPAWAAANSNLATAGAADSGTRLKASFQGIPAGAQLWVGISNGEAVLTANEVGALSPVASGQTIGGIPAAQLTVTNGAAIAVWEATGTSPNVIDTLDFPVWVVFPALSTPSGTLTVNGALAPNPDNGAFSLYLGVSAQNSSFPEPRFTSAIPIPTGITISPNTGLNTASVTVTLTSGSGSLTGSSAVLQASGVPDIPGTMSYGQSALGSPSANANFNLTGAAPGPRDVVVTPASGSPVTLPGAFLVTAGCSYTLAPTPQSFGVAGGNGQLVVSASPASCTWSASSDSAWLTLGSTIGNSVQNFTVAANTASTPLTGHITVEGQSLTVNQLGQASCTYSISPSSFIFPVAGGSTSVTVTAPAGCSWSVSNAPSWVTANGSGTGNGTVSVTTAANAGGLLSGSVTIAGQSFSVSQSASACGATDVSSQVKVTGGAYVSQPPLFNKFAQTVTLTNTGAASIAGPVSLALDGLPRTGSPCVAKGVSNETCDVYPTPPVTYCQSPAGSAIIPISSAGLAPGQSVSVALSFIPGASAGGSPLGLQYTPRVFSGTPNQ